ncbi:MAG: biotin-dependent carboxyltransferase family protein [Cloacibacillus sp.]
MELTVKKPGMLTTVQDLGRWGFQSSGVPVAGAMDLPALKIGNAMLGNDENAAALEVTLVGPELAVCGCGAAVFAGAELGFSVNGKKIGSWRAAVLQDGDVISFAGPCGAGCRGMLCFAGGVDVPPVMGSRSTFTRAKIGGVEGRALKAGDVIKTQEPAALWKRLDGFAVDAASLPVNPKEEPLLIIKGLQQDAFTEEGEKTLFDSEYLISAQSDRMGCRMEGPEVKHTESGADIVSDAIPLGAVQIPAHGMPIIMMADRQTTGGYTKIGVLAPLSIAALAQKMPGETVRFRRAEIADGEAEQRRIKDAVERVRQMRFSYVSRAKESPAAAPAAVSGHFILTVDGKSYDITCQEIKE